MEKLKKVLYGLIYILDRSKNCNDCPYHCQCKSDRECKPFIDDVKDVLIELFTDNYMNKTCSDKYWGNDPEGSSLDFFLGRLVRSFHMLSYTFKDVSDELFTKRNFDFESPEIDSLVDELVLAFKMLTFALMEILVILDNRGESDGA